MVLGASLGDSSKKKKIFFLLFKRYILSLGLVFIFHFLFSRQNS